MTVHFVVQSGVYNGGLDEGFAVAISHDFSRPLNLGFIFSLVVLVFYTLFEVRGNREGAMSRRRIPWKGSVVAQQSCSISYFAARSYICVIVVSASVR